MASCLFLAVIAPLLRDEKCDNDARDAASAIFRCTIRKIPSRLKLLYSGCHSLASSTHMLNWILDTLGMRHAVPLLAALDKTRDSVTPITTPLWGVVHFNELLDNE